MTIRRTRHNNPGPSSTCRPAPAILSAAAVFLFVLQGTSWALSVHRPVSQTIRLKEEGVEYVVKTVYRITGASEEETLGEGIFRRSPEGRFVVVRFSVRNNGNRPAPANILSDISLVTGKGETLGPSERATGLLRLGSGSFGLMELAPGAEMNDIVAFDVPAAVKRYFVRLPGGAKIGPLKYSKKPEGTGEMTDGKKVPEERGRRPETKKGPAEVTVKKPAKPAETAAGKIEGRKTDTSKGRTDDDARPRPAGVCSVSLEEYELQVKRAAEEGDRSLEGNRRYAAAECCVLKGKYADAARHYGMAAKIGSRLDDGEMEVLSLLGESRALASSGDVKRASEVFGRASKKAETEVFQNLWIVDYLKAVVSFRMAEALAEMGDGNGAVKRLDYARLLNYDFALEEKIFKLLMKTDKEASGKLEDIYALLDASHAAYERLDYAAMEKAAAQAFETAAALRYRKGMFEAEYTLANALSGRGDYAAALERAVRIRELAEAGNDYKRRVLAYNLAGDLYRLMKDYEKALAAYGWTLSLARAGGNRSDEAAALKNIGRVVMEKDKP